MANIILRLNFSSTSTSISNDISSTHIIVCTHTSPSGCHFEDCTTPMSASNSGKYFKMPSSRISSKPKEGLGDLSSNFVHSTYTRSFANASSIPFSTICLHKTLVSSAKMKPNLAQNCTALYTRKGSSIKVVSSICLSLLASMSSKPPKGSINAFSSMSYPRALTVKSLRIEAVLKSSEPSTSTSNPLCPSPTFASVRGKEKSYSSPSCTNFNTPKLLPTRLTEPYTPNITSNSSMLSNPYTSTS